MSVFLFKSLYLQPVFSSIVADPYMGKGCWLGQPFFLHLYIYTMFDLLLLQIPAWVCSVSWASLDIDYSWSLHPDIYSLFPLVLFGKECNWVNLPVYILIFTPCFLIPCFRSLNNYYSTLIFTHLKLCLAYAIHNFKWVKIIFLIHTPSFTPRFPLCCFRSLYG